MGFATDSQQAPLAALGLVAKGLLPVTGYDILNQRGHPLADPRQASKRFHGGLSRQYFQSQLPINKQTAPVSSIMAANESRQSPIRIKRSAIVCFRPGGFAAPEERWCRFVSNCCNHSFCGYPISVPTPRGLALQAIRFAARATAGGIPFRLMAGAPDPISGLAVTVVTHAKQRPASKGFCSFSMW